MYIPRETMEELSSYLPPLTGQADLDAFWDETIADAARQPLRLSQHRINHPAKTATVHEFTYHGYDETDIHGWLVVPVGIEGPVPCVIHFDGYGGNRGYPHDLFAWTTLGCAAISVDIREQSGHTGNKAQYSSGSMQSVVSKGLLNKEEYYYRAVFIDCLRAIDVAQGIAGIDPQRIILEGGSQGGALALAAAALDPRPWRVMADVPSLCNIEERVRDGTGSFEAVRNYLKIHPGHTGQVLETLSYFDLMNLAGRITCPVLAAVALKDTVCPAKQFFAAYNRIDSTKEIIVYPYNGHEDACRVHFENKLRWLAAALVPSPAETGW